MLKRLIICAALVSGSVIAHAQMTSTPSILRIPDQNGKAVPRKSLDNVKGNPFLFNEWSTGTVKLKDGTQYADVSLMYDQVDDVLMFKQNDKEFQFNVPVTEFSITNGKETKHFRSGFPVVDKNNDNTFYELLWENPNYSLLKQTSKQVIETTGYNQVNEKRFDTRTKYFLKKADGLVEVKPSSKSIIAALDSKSAEVLKGANIKNEATLITSLEKLN
jgi:hypothetical protein